MIKSDAQRERTATQVEGFRQALAKIDREMSGNRDAAVRAATKVGSDNCTTTSANTTSSSPAS